MICFSPSLSEKHDTQGFDQPLSPDGLVLLTAFCGLSGAGMFRVDNWRRLGSPRHQIWTGVVILIVAAAMMTTAELLQLTGVVPRGTEGSWMSFDLRMSGLVVAIVLAHYQRKRYSLFRVTNLPSGKWIIPIVVLLVVTLAFSLICVGLTRVIHQELFE
jgi:hypothetical protein